MRTLTTVMPRYFGYHGNEFHAGKARCVCGEVINFNMHGAECYTCGASYNDWGELKPPMDTAREYINDFCNFEYGQPADFSNPREIHIAYTDYEEYGDDGIEVQVSVDLVDFRIIYEYNDRRDVEEYESIERILPVLQCLDFNALVCLPEDMLEEA